MREKGRRRRHPHLSRATIATAALALVDREGVSSLSLRKVAAQLGVGTMTLYQYTPGRDALVADIVGLLLDEIDLRGPDEATWSDCARQIARSVRGVALRHPRAWTLVAGAASDKPPIIEYARRVRDLMIDHGIGAAEFVLTWTVLDSFMTGFLLLETQRINAAAQARTKPPDEDDLAREMRRTLSERSYEDAIDLILHGLAARGGR